METCPEHGRLVDSQMKFTLANDRPGRPRKCWPWQHEWGLWMDRAAWGEEIVKTQFVYRRLFYEKTRECFRCGCLKVKVLW